MNKKAKIFLVVLGLIVVAGIALYSGSASFFQGRLSKDVKPLPAYDENKCYDVDGGKNYEEAGTIYGKLSRSEFGNQTDVCTTRTKVKEYYCDGKFIQSEEYNCENGCSKGACKKEQSVNSDNALDTLVVVDTDSYDIIEADVKEFFLISQNLWLKPKTNISFNLTKIVFLSYSEECLYTPYGSCDEGELLDEAFFQNYYKELPEYIVFLTKDGTTINGGFGGGTTYIWLDPSMGSFYNSESKNQFCMEFPSSYNEDNYTIPTGFIDYKHKFMRCGYDETGMNVVSSVSGNGECKNQDGLSCIVQNGYQQCPNASEEDEFYLENPLYFSASTMVHELLHFYGQNGNLDHFGTYICNDAIGDMTDSVGLSEPFKTLAQEYATMCPNVWEYFKDSKTSCK